jgi:thiamine-phosphate pyrophosphorylase
MIAPRLIVISDITVAPLGVLEERIAHLCRMAAPGSVMIQLRDLALATRVRVELGRRLRVITLEQAQLFSVNDRIDLALLLEADGLHLGEGGVATADARRMADKLWISRALHECRHAPELEADALLLSPVIAPRKGRPALGLEELSGVRRSLEGLPARPALFALGGVTARTARGCLESGADGVAVSGAALGGEPVEPLLEALDAIRPGC